MVMIVVVSREMVILSEIPLGRRTNPWRRRSNVVERILTLRTLSELYREEAIQRQQSTHEQHHNICMTWCTSNMMHVMHDMASTTINFYTLSEAQYATSCILTELHIQIFSSLSFRYTTILNVVKHGKRWSIMKLHYLAILNEVGNNL